MVLQVLVVEVDPLVGVEVVVEGLVLVPGMAVVHPLPLIGARVQTHVGALVDATALVGGHVHRRTAPLALAGQGSQQMAGQRVQVAAKGGLLDGVEVINVMKVVQVVGVGLVGAL